MNFKNLTKKYTKLKGENQYMAYANAGLVLILGCSLYMNMQKDTVVMNNLNESCSYTEISNNWMHEENHRRLGIQIAQSLGNITPSNAKYTEKSVLPFASPEIYHKVNDLIALELAGLVEERVTMTFTTEKSFVEDGKTFVTGKGRMTGITGKSVPYVRTYEFIFDVENYTPTFSYINVYDDVPHDSMWQKKNNKEVSK
ncbi:TraE/TraK family type IV conjugative transfer system protein [Vibrio coralliilyticus]|uniref:Conjugal transfer protein TraE n=1 Tax=Vibrio coralliilyticus TaxID=190893 RepID=A0AAP6ZNN7_9VIBR|nr:TraE/TraK family type IV conjugative transfer system protein [Vibrio coralliilyticus]NOI31835.1 hypothetical protein [Vibrio coralliilyticus]NOJ25279.1 hypothetical protein [Vibrio coralliilyticus]